MKFNFSNFVKLFLAGATLLAVGCTDYGQDIQNLNDRVDKLETETNDKISGLQSDLKTVQDNLAKAQSDIKDQQAKHDKDVETLNGLISALDGKLTDAVADLEKAIKDGDDATKAELTKLINEEVAKINDQIKSLQSADEAINNRIDALTLVVNTNTENIDKLQAALDAYKAEVAGLFAKVNAEIDLLKEKDAKIEELIKALDERLKANEALAAQNAKDIAANKAAFDEYVAATAETLRLMQEAHDALVTRVGNLENDLQSYKEAIRNELDTHYAAFAAYQKEVADEFALVNEELKTQAAAIEANANAIKANKDLIDELRADHDALKAAYDDYVKKTDEVIATIQAEQLEQNNTLQLHAQQIGDLDQAVKDLDAKVDTVKAELEKKIADLEKTLQDQIDAIKGDLSALKGRIQSIVYVPEYTDGMATIEYAVFGNKIIECNSVMTYQVHPAECAGAVTKEDLSFLFQGLQTRAAVADAVQLEVVGVKVANATKGYIDVTVQAHNLGDNFYAGQAIGNDYSHYAVSLVFNHKVGEVENNIASCYTTLIAEKAENAAVISMGILNNEGKEIFDPQAQPVESHEIIYSDLETKKEFMPGSYPVFKLGSGKWFTYEQIVSAGYQISEPVQTITYNYYDKAGVETDAFKSVYNNVEAGEGYKYVTTNLAKVEKLAVKSYETVTYTYETDGNNASTTGKLTITKDKGTFDLGEVTVAWARNLDNNVTVFSRDNIGYVLAEKVLPGKNTSYAEAVAGTLTTLTVNGADILANAWDLTDDKMSAELVKVAADAEPVLKFEGFEWNKTYTFEAIYELDNIDVTINFAVKTVLPKYTINLEEMVITWNYAQDWKSTYGSENTNRELTVVVKDSKAEYTENAVPAYADVIKNGVQNSLTAPDPIYELLESIIKCSKFDWNKSYAFAAEYALADALVTINGSVKTVKADRKTTITLPESTLAMKKDMVVDDTHNAINDVLATAFTEENVADLCLGTTTVQDYLSAIFADASLPDVTVDVEKFVAVDADKDQHVTTYSDPSIQYTTEIRVAADGQSMNTYYNYKDVNVIPDLVVYTMTVTTWDEAVITFVKNVKFELPIYDYRHVLQWVYENDTKTGSFYSNALVSYDNDNGLVPFLQGCNVHLDMDTAFKVINTNTGNVIDDLGAEGLVSTFHFTANPNSDVLDAENPNIKFLRPLNMLQYHGKAESVAVKAALKFKNSDGTAERVLKTSFDEGYAQDASHDYSKYIVRPVDPVGTLKKTNLNIYVDTKAKKYTYYIGNLLELKDDRGFDLLAPGYLKEDNDNEVTWTQFSTVVGNLATSESNVSDSNGFKLNTDAASVYGITSIKFTCAGIPEDLAKKNQMVFDDQTGELYFDNTNQIELTNDIPLKITASVDYIWKVQTVDIEVWFKKQQ